MDEGLRIFISYRRSETRGYAGWLSDCLETEFGQSNVFRDVEKINAGDWRRAIDKSIRVSDIVLCLMGDQWLSMTDDRTGERRIDDPEDILRWEVSLSLTCKTSHNRVIPVLLDDAKMPEPGELPQDLAALPRQQAHRLTYETWRAGLDGLVAKLKTFDFRRPRALSGDELLQRWIAGADVPSWVGVAGGYPPKGTGTRLSLLAAGGGWRTQAFQVQYVGGCPSHPNWGAIEDFIAIVVAAPA